MRCIDVIDLDQIEENKAKTTGLSRMICYFCTFNLVIG
jgi:hypothetical protein